MHLTLQPYTYKYIIYSFHLAAQRWHLPDDARIPERAPATGVS